MFLCNWPTVKVIPNKEYKTNYIVLKRTCACFSVLSVLITYSQQALTSVVDSDELDLSE